MNTLRVDLARPWTSWRSLSLALITVAVFAVISPSAADAQALAPTITKSFNPPTVVLNNNSDATITVTNPNTFPISNVQFSDTMPAGIDLITQVGGTCSTPATGGGMFTINPGTETFSSTSSVLAAGQSCNIIVRVRGATVGVHLNTTSQVTATSTPAGGPASATLTVLEGVPALPAWMLLALAAGVAAMTFVMLARRHPGWL